MKPLSVLVQTLAPILAAMLAFGGANPAAAQATSNESTNARLLVSARTGDDAGVARALAAGAAVDSRNRLGETALVVALKRQQWTMAKGLVAAGTNVNLAAVNGITPLMAAAHGGSAEIVALLLDKGADLTPVDRVHKTAVVYAAGEGHTEIVRLFLARGVDVNRAYDNDLTALMWAAGYGRTATVRALLDGGADPRRRDNRGKTAAEIARDGKFDETARVLDDAGAKKS
ncbi:MAG: ankyrin repeat domain-containing protein [Betaproteobacteria bacterium]